jgi:hypothetical protein
MLWDSTDDKASNAGDLETKSEKLSRTQDSDINRTLKHASL